MKQKIQSAADKEEREKITKTKLGSVQPNEDSREKIQFPLTHATLQYERVQRT